MRYDEDRGEGGRQRSGKTFVVVVVGRKQFKMECNLLSTVGINAARLTRDGARSSRRDSSAKSITAPQKESPRL